MADEITLAQPYLDRNVHHPSDTFSGGQPPHAYKLLASDPADLRKRSTTSTARSTGNTPGKRRGDSSA